MTGVKIAEEAFYYSKSCRYIELLITGCTLGWSDTGTMPTTFQRFLRSEMVSDILRTFGWGGETATEGFSRTLWTLFPKLETSGKREISLGLMMSEEVFVYYLSLEGCPCEGTSLSDPASEETVSLSNSSLKENRESLVTEARSEFLRDTAGAWLSASASSRSTCSKS